MDVVIVVPSKNTLFALQEQSKLEEAVEAFNEALNKNPEYSDISGMSGLAELVLDKLISEFDKLVETNTIAVETNTIPTG